MEPYLMAQQAIASLKMAILETLKQADDNGLSNAQIGRSLGIYQGHGAPGRQEGHIPRTLLSLMEIEGVVKQDDKKRWHIRKQT